MSTTCCNIRILHFPTDFMYVFYESQQTAIFSVIQHSSVGLCSRDAVCLFWGRNLFFLCVIWMNFGLWRVGLLLMYVRTIVASFVPFLTSNVGFPCHQSVSFHRGTNEHVSHAVSRDLHIRVLQLLSLCSLQQDLAFLLRPFLRWGHEYMVPQGSGRATTVGSKTWPSADKALLRGGVLFTVAAVNVCSVLLSLPIV
jgi:hypothetical protein